MSVEYDGYSADTGFLTKLTNIVNRQQYNVSTVPKRKTPSGKHTYWEAAVFKRGFFGMFRPLFRIPNIAADEELIRKVHGHVKEFVEKSPPAKWPRGAMEYETFIDRYVMFSLIGLNDD
jgi:hypothetical protein